MQVIELSPEDQIKLYMKSCTKKQLATMLAECNRLLKLNMALNGTPDSYVTTVTSTDYKPMDIFSSEKLNQDKY